MAIRDTDLGWNRMKAELRKLVKQEVAVGLQAGDKTEDGTMDIARLGAIHEFGSPANNIPERSFVRSTFDANNRKWQGVKVRLVNDVIAGRRTADNALSLLGQIAQRDIQKKIVDGPFVPNAPKTIQRKGSDRPLIDTGHMRQSVRYVIRRRGSGQVT